MSKIFAAILVGGCLQVFASTTDCSQLVQNLGSPYLAGGYKEESFEITSIQVRENEILSTISFKSSFHSETDANGFHLSAVMALTVESQVAIVGYLHRSGFHAKPGEVWMKDAVHHYYRPIRNLHDVPLTIRIREVPPSPRSQHRQRASKRRTVQFEVNWDNGAFESTLTFVFEM